MRFRVLLAVFDDGLEDPCVLRHDLWLETDFHVGVLVRQHFHRFREHFEAELLGLLFIPLAHVELDRARYLIEVGDLELLDYAVRVLRREQSAEKEALLLYREHIGVEHLGHRLVAGSHHDLLLEDGLEVFGDDARDARLADVLVQNAVWLVV